MLGLLLKFTYWNPILQADHISWWSPLGRDEIMQVGPSGLELVPLKKAKRRLLDPDTMQMCSKKELSQKAAPHQIPNLPWTELLSLQNYKERTSVFIVHLVCGIL